MKLYEIIKEIENFELEVDEETGEILNIDALDLLQVEKNEKMENIALWIKNLDSDAKAIREEEKTLASRRQVKERKVEALKKYLATALAGEKLETARVRISYRKSQAVECDDVSLVPSEFLKVKYELDKTAIKTAIKNGTEVAGCSIVENNSIQIK